MERTARPPWRAVALTAPLLGVLLAVASPTASSARERLAQASPAPAPQAPGVAGGLPRNASTPALRPRLYGVVLGAGGELAYLEDPGTGQVRGYRIGQSIGDSRLIGIGADRVLLQQGSDVFEVRLGGVSGPGVPVPGLPPSPPASLPGSALQPGEAATPGLTGSAA